MSDHYGSVKTPTVVLTARLGKNISLRRRITVAVLRGWEGGPPACFKVIVPCLSPRPQKSPTSSSRRKRRGPPEKNIQKYSPIIAKYKTMQAQIPENTNKPNLISLPEGILCCVFLHILCHLLLVLLRPALKKIEIQI